MNIQQPSLTSKIETSRKSLIAIMHTDPFGMLQYIGPEFVQLAQRPAEKFLECHLAHLISRQVPRVITDALYLNMSQGKSFSGFFLLKNDSDTPCWAFISITPEYEQEQLTGFCLICRYVPVAIRQKIQPLYQQLLMLENNGGTLASHFHIQSWMAQKGQDLSQVMRRIFQEKNHELLTA
ncbi:MAG: hypothetical protein IBX50_00880 [Marinospirillum sp.]|uniref:hypothetical protein n=1 Tax=Marinospirillum sp. TaxID=2183934 RepID=UPI0019E6F85E|nr:hypothetical protein [Marinospirillum sp.]MBE0505255.1 hypothetical protein [Marinospirillum sp.]